MSQSKRISREPERTGHGVPAPAPRQSRGTAASHENRRLLPEPDRRHGHGDADVPCAAAGVSRRDTLIGVIKPQVAPTLDGSPWFDDRIFFDHRSSNRRSPHRRWSFAGCAASGFDLAVLLPNSFRLGLVAWLAGIPERVGYARHGRGCLLTDTPR